MNQRELRRVTWKRLRPWVVVYVGTVAVVAVVAGIVWNRLVSLPAYMVSDDYRARMPESGLSQIVATDVYYSLVGLVAGLIIGLTAMVLFHRLGWMVTVIAAVGAGLAGAITRAVGEFIGPRDFPARIAAATRGDEVTIDFTAHTWAPLAIWVGMAVVPVLLGSLARRQVWIRHTPQTEPATQSPPEENR